MATEAQISRVRFLIGDPAGETAYWSDADLEDAIDATNNIDDNPDLYTAAAEVLTAWAARIAREFDFQTEGGRFDRSQQTEALLSIAKQYRGKGGFSIGLIAPADELPDENESRLSDDAQDTRVAATTKVA